MNNYDSILKEEKKEVKDDSVVNENPNKKNHKKIFYIDLMIIIIIVIISYIFYYQRILTPQNIFLNDAKEIYKLSKAIINPLQLNLEDETYSLNGTISFDNNQYTYDIIREHKNIQLNLSREEKKYIYYLNDTTSFTKLENEEYISKEKDNLLNCIRNIKENFPKLITDEQFIKRIYWSDNNPVVEINLVLDKNKINKLLNTENTKNDYEITFTLKNNAITNQFLNAKIIIADKKKNKRVAIVYYNNIVEVTNNDGSITKYELQNKGKDFSIKINKKKHLYSIINGTQKENDYQYTYQIIDKPYNLILDVITKDKNNITYNFTSHIGNNNEIKEEKLTIETLIKKEGALSEENPKHISYSNLPKENQKEFDDNAETFFLPIREFINKYKESINSIQNNEDNS